MVHPYCLLVTIEWKDKVDPWQFLSPSTLSSLTPGF